jgi:transcriptional repressor NrdR
VRCPLCGHLESKVLDSRPTDEGAAIRRRRECLGCGERFTTYEKVEARSFAVVKKDGRREAFEPEKVLRGLVTACEKRPVSLETLEGLVRDIERELRARFDREVPSREIGEAVMQRLQGLDQVAYVRFASVYRQFQDLARFKEELERLLSSEGGR